MTLMLQSPHVRKWANRLVPLVFYALLIVFLALYLRSVDFSKLAHLTLNWWYLGLASVLALITRYIGTFTWFAILRTLGARDLRLQKQLVYVYAKAWMGRYIPGTAPWILGKIYFASQHGISKQKLAVSSLLEGGLQIVTMLVFSLCLLLFDRRLDVMGGGFKLLMVLVAIAGIVILTPRVFNRLFGFAYKLLRRKTLEPEHTASVRTMVWGTSLYLVNAVINGLSLFFIAKGVDPSLAYSNILFAMGAASLAGAASMLAIFAPSGLGVREGIQLVLFSLIMPKELALAVTLATRLWSVGIDFVFLGLSRLLAGRSKATPADQAHPAPAR
ncbi:MAG TPA: lysylphosphatidylglycerol synthase domain-containing protein [Candidatus Saccharimonadales bacterium]|nr:lysylphosphatidylglycerol synthase domain-containing protein [Candidatus Saccharimonadales bacterium]